MHGHMNVKSKNPPYIKKQKTEIFKVLRGYSVTYLGYYS
jgi:hypothetical protein